MRLASPFTVTFFQTSYFQHVTFGTLAFGAKDMCNNSVSFLSFFFFLGGGERTNSNYSKENLRHFRYREGK